MATKRQPTDSEYCRTMLRQIELRDWKRCRIHMETGGDVQIISGDCVVATFNRDALKRDLSAPQYAIFDLLLGELMAQSQVAAYAVEVADMARGTAGGRKKAENARKLHATIRADANRFANALASYQRMDLPPLLREFKVDEKKWGNFGPSNVRAALAVQYSLSARQIRNILDDMEIC
jgi:hypothetical protein